MRWLWMAGELNREGFRRNVILGFALGITGLLLWMIREFIEPLFLAAVFSGLLHPFYDWLRARVRYPWLASVLTVLGFFLVALLLSGLLVGVVAKEAVDLSEKLMPAVSKHMEGSDLAGMRGWVVERVPWLGDVLPDSHRVAEKLGELSTKAADFIVRSLSTLTTGAAGFILKLFVMLYAMFFFLKDGPEILHRGKLVVPLSEHDKDKVLDRFLSVTRATLKGSLVIGVLQGGLCGAALWLAGIESPVFLGVLMMVLSVIPGLGAPLVWVPAVIVLWVRGDIGWAIGVTAWCAAVVGNVDNVLRPRLVGHDTKMPDLLILVGTLGGIFLFGIVGFIVGPIICALFLTAWEIYVVAFRQALDPNSRRGAHAQD